MSDMRDITITLVEPQWVRVADKENKTTFDYIHIDSFCDMMPPLVADALEASGGNPIGLRLWAREED